MEPQKKSLLRLWGDNLIDALTELAENGSISLLGVNDDFVFATIVNPELTEQVRKHLKGEGTLIPDKGVITIVAYGDKTKIMVYKAINAAVDGEHGTEDYVRVGMDRYKPYKQTGSRDVAFLKLKYKEFGEDNLPEINFAPLAKLMYSKSSTGDNVVLRTMRNMAFGESVPAAWLNEIMETKPRIIGNLLYLAAQYNAPRVIQILTDDYNKDIEVDNAIAEALKPHGARINNAKVLEAIESLRLGDALVADNYEDMAEMLAEKNAKDDDEYGPSDEKTGQDFNMRGIPDAFDDFATSEANLLGWALIFGAENIIRLIMGLEDATEYAERLPSGLALDAFAHYGEKLRFFYDWLSDRHTEQPDDIKLPSLEQMLDATGTKYIDSLIRNETRGGEEGALGKALGEIMWHLDMENDDALRLVQRYANKLTDKDIVTPNANGATLLHLAADSDNEPLIRLLLEKNPAARHASYGGGGDSKPFRYLSNEMAKKMAPDFDESLADEAAKDRIKYNARRRLLLDYDPNDWVSDEEIIHALKDGEMEPEGEDGEYTEEQIDRERQSVAEGNSEYALDVLKDVNAHAPLFIDGDNVSDLTDYLNLDARIKIERVGNRLYINGDLVQVVDGHSEDRDRYNPSYLHNVPKLSSYE